MSNLFVKKKFAEIKELKNLQQDNEDMLRVWCTQAPDVFCFQIRTFKPITEWGKGKSRNMMANVNLTITEVEEILAYMKEQYPNSKPANTKKLDLIEI